MSEEEDPWSQALQEHYEAALCEVCHQHVELGVTGTFYPIGSGMWAAWYHDVCRQVSTPKEE
jgi:hypothetical protein